MKICSGLRKVSAGTFARRDAKGTRKEFSFRISGVQCLAPALLGTASGVSAQFALLGRRIKQSAHLSTVLGGPFRQTL